jgi:hypothetical protein
MFKRLLFLALLLVASPVYAQQTKMLATAVATCGGQSLTAGLLYAVTQDLTGTLCTGTGGGGGGTAVTIADGASVTLGAKADAVCSSSTGTCTLNALVKYLNAAVVDTTPVNVVMAPSSLSGDGITPVVSAAAEAAHVLKASAGNAYSAYATNLTSTNGFLVLLNLTAAPADGAITPLACAPLSANGNASINYAPGPPGAYSTGITAVVTSASTCFTKTTGTITAFISGSVK